jgi:hypothetical protein
VTNQQSNLEQACVCSSYSLPSGFEEQITAFYQLRNSCPALKLTIPDQILERHIAFTNSPLDANNHCSIPFLAYRHGYLEDFTKSLHKFSFDKEISAQYRRDLQETWVLEPDETLRFKKTRNYLSRLAELDFARWLELEQWEISNLEIYGGSYDVQAFDNNQRATSFEVKFLAQRELVFELIRDSFTSPTVARLGVYSPIDYLLFRLYEAAQQLKNSPSYRVAVAIVSDYQLSFKIPLSEGWINWSNAQFLKRDSEIFTFLDKEYTKNPNLDADLITTIQELDEIWILQHRNHFDLHLEHRIQLK